MSHRDDVVKNVETLCALMDKSMDGALADVAQAHALVGLVHMAGLLVKEVASIAENIERIRRA